MKRTLSHSGRRALALLLAAGYNFQTTVEGIAWRDGDISCGCESTLQLAVEKAKRHYDQGALKRRLQLSRTVRHVRSSFGMQLQPRLPG